MVFFTKSRGPVSAEEGLVNFGGCPVGQSGVAKIWVRTLHATIVRASLPCHTPALVRGVGPLAGL